MPVIQRTKHPAEDIEEFIIAGLTGDLRSEDVVLPFPVDIPQFEKWVSLVEGLPQDFKILFGVANHNDSRSWVRQRGWGTTLQSARSRQAAERKSPECAGRRSAARLLWSLGAGSGLAHVGTDKGTGTKHRRRK